MLGLARVELPSGVRSRLMNKPGTAFLEDFGLFVEAEVVRDPSLAQPMRVLSDALKRAMPVVEHPEQPSQPVVSEHLEDALRVAVGVPGELIRSIVELTGWAVPYLEYVGEPDMDAMRSNYAYAPLIGSPAPHQSSSGAVSAPYLSDEVFAGLVLQGPGCVYPSHVHKSEEMFWVASGTADWQCGDTWRVEEPGAVIHHPSGTRHATVTRADPLLMLFAWVSDPDSIPVIVRF